MGTVVRRAPPAGPRGAVPAPQHDRRLPRDDRSGRVLTALRARRRLEPFEQITVAEHLERVGRDAPPDEEVERGCGAARGDVAFRVDTFDGGTAGFERDEPLALG